MEASKDPSDIYSKKIIDGITDLIDSLSYEAYNILVRSLSLKGAVVLHVRELVESGSLPELACESIIKTVMGCLFERQSKVLCSSINENQFSIVPLSLVEREGSIIESEVMINRYADGVSRLTQEYLLCTLKQLADYGLDNIAAREVLDQTEIKDLEKRFPDLKEQLGSVFEKLKENDPT